MSPALLAEYLRVARESGALQFGLEVPLAYADGIHVAKVSAVFGPTMAPETDEPAITVEGSWKRAVDGTSLDLPWEDDEVAE